MPLSTEVQLSVNKTPRFPKRCIVCSGKSPDARMRVGDLLTGWFSLFTDIPEGWGSVTVPVHSSCKRPFRLRRWLTRLGYMALAFLIWWRFGEQIEAVLPDAIRRPGRQILLAAFLFPVFLIELFLPPRFDITFSKYYVTFEFADSRYALDFAKTNDELRRYEEIRSEMPFLSDE